MNQEPGNDVFRDDYVMVKRDILRLKILELLNLPEQEFSLLRLQVSMLGDVKTVGDLKQRILEFIHLASLQMVPVRLAAISRRFSRIAKKLGTSTPDIIHELIGTGRVVMLERRGITALFSSAVREEQTTAGAPSTVIDTLMSNVGTIE